MKKGKVFGKAQIALVLMVLGLGAAVWLNMRFSSNKYLGEATLVNAESGSEAVPTSAKVATDSFSKAVADRQSAYEEAEEWVRTALDCENLSDSDKVAAVNRVKQIADHIEKAEQIETLLRAKGFEKAVAVIGDNAVTAVVQSDGLTTTQTLQIQDVIIAQTAVSLGNIKIIAVK